MRKLRQSPVLELTGSIVGLGLLIATPALAQVGKANHSSLGVTGSVGQRPNATAPSARRVDFAGHSSSGEVRQMVDWVVRSGDNLELPFVIIDKRRTQALAFDAKGRFQGAAPVLIGVGRGDISPAGIGQRRLADIPAAERITPAGRFLASLGRDLGVDDVLWVDYEAGISLHRVVPGNVSDRRLQRLATATTSDNRISYGCINVPKKFFESVVRPMFNGSNGIVYILPELAPLNTVFQIAATIATDPARP